MTERPSPDAPALSVVVAASNGPARLAATLESLRGQEGVGEVIVASNFSPGPLAAAHPTVRFETAPAGTTVPMLRTLGVRAARGAAVALTEDNVVPAPGWARALGEAHAAGHPVVGGPIEQPEAAASRDWAVFFYEYGRFMPPVAPGPVDRLAGNNVSYARPLLDTLAEEVAAGVYEVFLHEALQKRGVPLVMAPAAVVHHPKTYPVAEVVRQCYHHGRGYAGMRVAGSPPLRRAAWGLAATALPVLLPARITLQTLRKRRRLGHLVRALPYLVGFMTAWAAGECAGYLAGPGESARAWS